MEDANTTGIVIVYVMSFIVTWAIGLFPPVAVRYMIRKKPMEKLPAILMCAGLLVANIIIFTLMGSKSKTHGALLLISFISYWILRHETLPAEKISPPLDEK